MRMECSMYQVASIKRCYSMAIHKHDTSYLLLSTVRFSDAEGIR